MKNIFLIILISFSIPVFGQTINDSLGIKLFNRGIDFYKQGKLDSTLVLWTEIVDKNIDGHPSIYGAAFFNIPTVYWQLKKYELAKEWYKKILSSNLKDNEETGELMEPHANYKHKSALALAELCEIDSNYNEALEWLNQADKVYRYWGFEGSATNITKKQAYLLNRKTTTLLKLDRKDEAIRTIIIELICSNRLESFFTQSEKKLLTMIDKKEFKSDLDNSLDNLVIENIDKNNWLVTFELHKQKYVFSVANIYPDRNIPHYWTKYFINKDQTVDKLKLIEYIKQRSFYIQMSN
jgi:tetratricopeptide (TPR) repeat protein